VGTGQIFRLVVAGGEIFGAVIEGLRLEVLEIGTEIELGIPALPVGPEIVVPLTSGNFDPVDFFEKTPQIFPVDQ